jgi:hypothetical protein
VDPPLFVRIIQVIWRPAVVPAKRMIARFDEPKNGVERLALLYLRPSKPTFPIRHVATR